MFKTLIEWCPPYIWRRGAPSCLKMEGSPNAQALPSVSQFVILSSYPFVLSHFPTIVTVCQTWYKRLRFRCFIRPSLPYVGSCVMYIYILIWIHLYGFLLFIFWSESRLQDLSWEPGRIVGKVIFPLLQ